MFPILPILILLFLGPANAERLANEGRLPAAILAVHLAQIAPIRAVVTAPAVRVERAVEHPSATHASPVNRVVPRGPLRRAIVRENPGCPPRAGPQVA